VTTTLDVSDLLGNWHASASHHVDPGVKGVGFLGKVGPHGYSHGWVKVGPGLSVKDVKSDADGNVVHKTTGEHLGRIHKVNSKTVAGYHADDTKVYEGPIKSGALVNIVIHHNKVSTKLNAVSKPSNLLPTPKPAIISPPTAGPTTIVS